MYMHDVFVENMGAIEKFQLLEKQLIKEDGSPKPIILVGKNGSGKTTLISSIVDALYELSSDVFSDVLPLKGTGRLFFKISGSSNVRVNQNYAFAFVNFKREEVIYQYLDKNLDIDFSGCVKKTNDLLVLPNTNNDFKKGNQKIHTDTSGDEKFREDLIVNSYCYFPSDRYELPYWINRDVIEEDNQFREGQYFTGELNKKILVRTSLEEVKQWILDVVLDSRADLYFDPETEEVISRSNLKELKLFQKSILNIEKVISKIVQRDISLNINYRLKGLSRIKLVDKQTGQDYIPALDNLSAGQSTLLSIFITIIMHSDVNDLSKSIELDKISGIVIIDEVDLHLHIELQKEILPKLIKLFPKIQFIISSHSPFFLAGMSEIFESEDYIVVNISSGDIIERVDDFEEFSKAYSVFKDITGDYKVELDILKAKLQESSKPLIVTEGKTDWMHLKAALNALSNCYPMLHDAVEFYEYEDIEMGDTKLKQTLENLKDIPQSRKIIGVFDRDNKVITKDYADREFNILGNNVYALCIPAIDDTLDAISTEYYYLEDDLKRQDINGRRLFDEKEFIERSGNSYCGSYQMNGNKCTGKLKIVDSGVYHANDPEWKNSLALSKSDFAKNVLDKTVEFNNIDFTNFKKIFDIIEKIINDY